MFDSRIHGRSVVQVGAVLVMLLASPLGAQSKGAPDGPAYEDRVPVTIALVDDLGHEAASAVIWRRAETSPRDVVLLDDADATPSRLSAAIVTLLAVRSLMGDVPEEDITLPVPQNSGVGAFRGRTMRDITAVLGRLRETESGDLPGVGTVPHVTVWLPAGFPVSFGNGSGA